MEEKRKEREEELAVKEEEVGYEEEEEKEIEKDGNVNKYNFVSFN